MEEVLRAASQEQMKQQESIAESWQVRQAQVLSWQEAERAKADQVILGLREELRVQRDQGERDLAAMKEQMDRQTKDIDRAIAKEVWRTIASTGGDKVKAPNTRASTPKKSTGGKASSSSQRAKSATPPR